MKSFSPVLLHGRFKLIKVKAIIINGFPAPIYKGLEAIECLLSLIGFNGWNGNNIWGKETSIRARKDRENINV